ncbi:formyltransferase family protein [Candidatus Pelagibacter ubique]|nr:formyltransferase family protein [Candidatus Pelagibacter ubique]
MKSSKIRLCLFGTSILNEYISQNYKKNHIEHMCIITHAIDNRDFKLLNKHRLYPQKKNIKCNIYYLPKYDEEKIIKILKKNKINFGLSSGCRFIFKNKIIKYFNKKFFNIHDSYLPFYKGGAPLSYSIMNQEKYIGVSFHEINKKIDGGKVFYKKKIPIKKNAKPIDVLNYFYNFVKKNIFKFIKLKRKIPIHNNSQGTYFSRLNSEINGFLNLNWTTKECISFINSFSDPYPGAHVLYKGKKVVIKNAKIYSNKKYHSFLNGKITNVGNDYIKVIMGNKIVELKNLFFKDKIIIPKLFFKSGETIYNLDADLTRAKKLIHKYF